MKLEKREVTLNEKDSLKDLLIFARTLTAEYVYAAPLVEGEERRAKYVRLLTQSVQTLFDVADLWKEGMKED